MRIYPKDLHGLEGRLALLDNDVTIAYFTEEFRCRHCREEYEFLKELTGLTHKLHLETYHLTADRKAAADYGVDKAPAMLLVGSKDYGVRYYGVVSELEFDTFLEDLQRISSGESGLSSLSKQRLADLREPLRLEVLSTWHCPYTAAALRLAHQMAVESDLVTGDLINSEDFPEIAQHYGVMAAPTVVANGRTLFYGVLPEDEFVDKAIEAAKPA